MLRCGWPVPPGSCSIHLSQPLMRDSWNVIGVHKPVKQTYPFLCALRITHGPVQQMRCRQKGCLPISGVAPVRIATGSAARVATSFSPAVLPISAWPFLTSTHPLPPLTHSNPCRMPTRHLAGPHTTSVW